jgi:hypothetical protein
MPTFRRNVLSPSSGLKRRDYIEWQEGKSEGMGKSEHSVLIGPFLQTSEILAPTDQSTRRQNPGEHHHYSSLLNSDETRKISQVYAIE